jgi:hypothetical protein
MGAPALPLGHPRLAAAVLNIEDSGSQRETSLYRSISVSGFLKYTRPCGMV